VLNMKQRFLTAPSASIAISISVARVSKMPPVFVTWANASLMVSFSSEEMNVILTTIAPAMAPQILAFVGTDFVTI